MARGRKVGCGWKWRGEAVGRTGGLGCFVGSGVRVEGGRVDLKDIKAFRESGMFRPKKPAAPDTAEVQEV